MATENTSLMGRDWQGLLYSGGWRPGAGPLAVMEPATGQVLVSVRLAGAAQVVLVEGEKCAQALIDANVAATTAMHGANAPVDKTDWSPLSGKVVLIWPDRDKPGWEYAAQAAQAVLAAGAKSCHILYPPEDAP